MAEQAGRLELNGTYLYSVLLALGLAQHQLHAPPTVWPQPQSKPKPGNATHALHVAGLLVHPLGNGAGRAALAARLVQQVLWGARGEGGMAYG